MKKILGLILVAFLAAIAVWLFEGDIDAEVVDAKYSNSQSQFFSMPNGARVHFRDQGQVAGPALVLVHGSNASLHTWEPWVAILGSTYRVITLDLPGHGLTGAVPDKRYDSQAQLATVAALVEHLNLSNFVLGGNSMGGGVTWRYALQHREQIDALILVDASGLWQWREQEKDASENPAKNPNQNSSQNSSQNKGPLVFRLLREPWFRSIAAYLDTRALTAQGLRSAFHDKSKVTDEMIDLFYNMSMRKGTREATLARFASYKPGANNGAPTETEMATLTMPALILWGATDALTPPSNGENFRRVLPNSKLIVYPQVGHVPMEEIPERSAADVIAFLESQRLNTP